MDLYLFRKEPKNRKIPSRVFSHFKKILESLKLFIFVLVACWQYVATVCDNKYGPKSHTVVVQRRETLSSKVQRKSSGAAKKLKFGTYLEPEKNVVIDQSSSQHHALLKVDIVIRRPVN